MKTEKQAEMFVNGSHGPIDMSLVRSFIKSMSDIDNADLEMQIDIYGGERPLCIRKEAGDCRSAIVGGPVLGRTPGRHPVPGRRTASGRYTRAEYRSCRSWPILPCLPRAPAAGAFSCPVIR